MKTETKVQHTTTQAETHKEIPFTQYLRPNGKPIDVYFPTTDELFLKAKKLISDGYRFEVELLMSGEVSLSVSDGEEDIAIQICTNGPRIEKYVETLILEAIAKAEAQ